MGDSCCNTGCCADGETPNDLDFDNCCNDDCCDTGCCDDSCMDDDDLYLPVQVGLPAPYFELEGYLKGEKSIFSLDDFDEKWTLLFFYPLDFTFVCPTELLELNKKIKEFEKINTQVLAVSVDSVFSHEAWSKDLGNLNYPLLSDITKETSMDYNVLIPDQGIALRGAFIINPNGIIKSMTVNDLDTGRNIDELIRTIKALQTGDLCPANWNEGDKTLGQS